MFQLCMCECVCLCVCVCSVRRDSSEAWSITTVTASCRVNRWQLLWSASTATPPDNRCKPPDFCEWYKIMYQNCWNFCSNTTVIFRKRESVSFFQRFSSRPTPNYIHEFSWHGWHILVGNEKTFVGDCLIQAPSNLWKIKLNLWKRKNRMNKISWDLGNYYILPLKLKNRSNKGKCH